MYSLCSLALRAVSMLEMTNPKAHNTSSLPSIVFPCSDVEWEQRRLARGSSQRGGPRCEHAKRSVSTSGFCFRGRRNRYIVALCYVHGTSGAHSVQIVPHKPNSKHSLDSTEIGSFWRICFFWESRSRIVEEMVREALFGETFHCNWACFCKS